MTSTTTTRTGVVSDRWDGVPLALRTVVVAIRNAFADEPWPSPEADPDWELVHSIAGRHQVTPLVYEGLSAADAPASVVERLREEVRRTTKRNLRSTRELLRLLEEFEAEGVRAIPVKGPVLARVAYDDLNRRTFLDLDVLVHPDDVLDAGLVLQERGYDASEEFGLLRRFGRDSPLLADVSECSFHHPDHDEVELRWQHGHWANPLATSFDGWWRRRETATVGGRDVAVLSPEDRILMLATHANKHAWRRLAWLADLTASIRAHDDVDWDALERRAASWGVTPAVRVGVALSSSLSEEVAETVPPDVRRRVREDRLAAILADRATARLAENPLGTPSRLEEVAFDFAAAGSVRNLPRSTGRLAAASTRYVLRFAAGRASR